MKSKQKSILRITLLSASACTGLALMAPLKAETLREALAKAYESNPTLTGARAGQKATNESVPIAKAEGRPSVNLQSNYFENIRNTPNSFTAPDRLTSNDLTLNVPAYRGGAVKNNILAAKTRVQAGFANLRATESALFSNVVAAYMDVIRDEAVVDLNRAQVGVLSVNLEATKDRFEIGDLTRTDVAQSEARFAEALGNLQNARANLIRSKEIYLQLVGSAPGELSAPPPLPGLPDNPDEAVTVALEQNPDLISAQESRDAATLDVKSARAGRLPTVDAFAQGNYTNFLDTLGGNIVGANFIQATTTLTVGVRATIPIYQGGRPSAQIRQSQSRLSQAQEQEIAAERDVIAQTRASHASWKASLELTKAFERAVEANTLSLEGVRAENSVGNRTVLDILNAEQELLNSRVQLVTAQRNAYVAGFTLLAAMGKAEARDLGLDENILYDPIADYNAVKNSFNDWSSSPNPDPQASRTVDSTAQIAPIEPLPENSGPIIAD